LRLAISEALQILPLVGEGRGLKDLVARRQPVLALRVTYEKFR
jgi:hypothetical protein